MCGGRELGQEVATHPPRPHAPSSPRPRSTHPKRAESQSACPELHGPCDKKDVQLQAGSLTPPPPRGLWPQVHRTLRRGSCLLGRGGVSRDPLAHRQGPASTQPAKPQPRRSPGPDLEDHGPPRSGSAATLPGRDGSGGLCQPRPCRGPRSFVPATSAWPRARLSSEPSAGGYKHR